MPQADEQAIDWILRLRDAKAEDWERFTIWLEANAANAAAYERLALIDADAAERMRTLPVRIPTPVLDTVQAVAPADTLPARRTMRRYWFGGVAAGVAAAIGATALFTTSPATYAVTTVPGEKRSVALADGTRIEMNGETRLLLDRHDPRTAELVGGEAQFTVVHDAAAPFVLRVGEAQVEDLGTVFDVRRRDSATEVSVASGAVLYNPSGAALRLGPGDRIRDPDGPAPPSRSRIAPTEVAEWRSARLSFDNQSLAEVATEIRATSGLAVRASPAVAERRFTGIVTMDGDPETLARRLAALLDVKVLRQGKDWLLLPASAPR